MAESKKSKEIIFKTYEYGTREIATSETLGFSRGATNADLPPWTLDGKALQTVIVMCDKDFVTSSYDYVSRNISVYNGFYQKQTVTVKGVAIYY